MSLKHYKVNMMIACDISCVFDGLPRTH